MAALRHPETGCPWDVEQTFASIAHYTIEEAYEVVDCIERNDLDELCAELGDLLLQVVFHARMAEELGAFNIVDVINSISEKMRSRHPHVFAVDSARPSSDMQSVQWEDRKAQERAARNSGKTKTGALDGVAYALPALMRAQKLQKRAARVGFDWPTPQAALPKIQEEAAELMDAYASGDDAGMLEEAGDLLFSCVNVVRKLGIDAEVALRAANAKFVDRFETMEDKADASGTALADLSLERLDALWNEVKKAHSGLPR